jgi:hypothetical protein
MTDNYIGISLDGIFEDTLAICLMSKGVIEDMHLLAMACTFILIRLDLSVSCVEIYTRMDGHVIQDMQLA